MSNTTQGNTSISTPDSARGTAVTQAIMNFAAGIDANNDDDEPNAKRSRYLKFTPEQLSQLIIACSTPGNIVPSNTPSTPYTSTTVTPSPAPAYVANAKYEEISCKPIRPPYEGTEADLMSFLLRLDIRRQDEGWAPATYITVAEYRYDLTIEFAHVTEENIQELASTRWKSPTVSVDKHTLSHDTYNSRLLAKCLLASISPELSLTLLNRIPTLYRNDGTYILWTLTNNIYRNNIAFVESIREKIVTTTVSHHDNNIEKYLIYIKNQLRMITTKPTAARQHRGLITYILRQLKTTANPIFLRYVQDLHVSYQEGKLPEYTPTKLIIDVEDKIRVLTHAEVWETPASTDTPAMALTAHPTVTDQLKEFLANQITTEINRLSGINKQTGKDTKNKGTSSRPDWLYTPPAVMTETKTVQNRVYHWCTKCNRGNGQWVITHKDSTHRDDYKHQNKRQEPGPKPGILKQAHQAAQAQTHNLPTPVDTNGHTPSAQLSLSDGLSRFVRFDVQDLHNDDD
jgi:hypothetical protein